ncbi:MAG: hypothetical protein M5U34_26285 [Chloroflexi bacterium]|nr:hypothetical protein [Chloroflexota bacterium]
MDIPIPEDNDLLVMAETRLRRLSTNRLRVANDFLAYLEERESSEATEELLSIPGFEEALQEAVMQSKNNEIVSFFSHKT